LANDGQSSAGKVSIGVCEVARPRTMSAMIAPLARG
jgi:glycerate kinase